MLSNAAAAGDLHWMAEHTSEDLGLPKEREREREREREDYFLRYEEL